MKQTTVTFSICIIKFLHIFHTLLFLSQPLIKVWTNLNQVQVSVLANYQANSFNIKCNFSEGIYLVSEIGVMESEYYCISLLGLPLKNSPYSGWLKYQKLIFSQFHRVKIKFLIRSLSLACRWPPLCCLVIYHPSGRQLCSPLYHQCKLYHPSVHVSSWCLSLWLNGRKEREWLLNGCKGSFGD
jgi:hypothetical protein